MLASRDGAKTEKVIAGAGKINEVNVTVSGHESFFLEHHLKMDRREASRKIVRFSFI